MLISSAYRESMTASENIIKFKHVQKQSNLRGTLHYFAEGNGNIQCLWNVVLNKLNFCTVTFKA